MRSVPISHSITGPLARSIGLGCTGAEREKALTNAGGLSGPPLGVHYNPRVFGLGVICLVLVFVLSLEKVRRRLILPPSLAVVIVGLVIGRLLNIDSHHMISIPDNILKHGIVLPNFVGLFADHSLAWVIVTSVLTLVLIDGVESLATIQGIDKVDPFNRRSDPKRTLMAMGISNICSSLAGGLTIIPGGVKSKLCIVSGRRTLWANFYNALFLIGFLLFGKGLINLIPYSALAAILIHTGYKLCEPRIWKHVAHVGREQLVLFTATVFTTLATDLLCGIFVGMGLKLCYNLAITSRPFRYRPAVLPSSGLFAAGLHGLRSFVDLFRNPVIERQRIGEAYVIRFDRPMVCFNTVHLHHELLSVPADVADIILHFGERVSLIDHTTSERLTHFVEEHRRSGRWVEFVGMDRLIKTSEAETSMRIASVTVPDAAV